MSNLTAERQFSSKKPDLYFETTVFGSRRRYAVECKDYTRTLDQGHISKIAAGYEALFKSGEITDLLIVANAELGPSARSYVEELPHVSYMTEEGLRNSIIDFRGYLAGLKARFTSNPVYNYFVEPHGGVLKRPGEFVESTPSDDHPHLRSLILQRLEAANHPLVVLGAYGIGKTTLAETLFLDLIRQWERQPNSPIPIYISLDQMRKEQTLEGLLGALFTSTAPAPGYNFDLFRRMNSLGHFTIILDGLDEMRHKLSREEFLFNVDQLAILSDANPRTVLLGRPSAFMGEDEYEYVVHGRTLRPTGFILGRHKAYEELYVAELTLEQVEAFATAFCRWRYPKEPRTTHKVMAMLARHENRILADVARRPVQLMMLLEIFPQLPERLDQITKATVYSLFIDELIARELAKPVGRAFKPAEHRLFGRRAAWWLWKQGGVMGIEASSIPADVLEPLVSKTDDIDTVRRSLVSASFLTTEGGTHLRFPHRSIQEFFVAEHLADLLSRAGEFRASLTMPDLTELVTSEVVDFLSSQLNAAQTIELMSALDHLRIVPQSLLALMHAGQLVPRTIEQYFRRTGSVAAMWFCVHEAIRTKPQALPDRMTPADLRERLLSLAEDRIARYRRDATYSETEANQEVASYLLALVIISSQEDKFREFERAIAALAEMGRSSAGAGPTLRRNYNGKVYRLARLSIDLLRRFDGESAIGERIKIDWLYRYLRAVSASQTFVPEWVSADTIRIPGARMKSSLDGSDARNLAALLAQLRAKRQMKGN